MKYIHFIFFLGWMLNCLDVRSSSGPFVTTHIRYTSEEASEVYLVWGVNDWQLQEKVLLPAGTYIKDNLMYSPMKFQEGVFSVQLKTNAATKIDYVFWITKGLRNSNTDIWDLNKAPQKDYQTIAVQDNIVLVESTLPARPKEALSLLDFALPILLVIATLFLIFFAIKKYRYKQALHPGPAKIILSSAGILLLALFFIRTSVLLISWDLYLRPFEYMMPMLWAGFYDLIYVDIIMVVFLCFLFPFRKFPRIRFAIAYFFVAICLLSLIAAILNIRMVEMLGKPFNYRWLYYSDFMNSADSKSALVSNLSFDYVMNIIIVCVSAILAGILLAFVMGLFTHNNRRRKIFLASILCLQAVYLVFAQKAIQERNWNYDKLANPVVAFMESFPFFTQDSELFTMQVPDSLKIFDRKIKNQSSYSHEGTADHIKNIIVFVMESTPAEYIQPYDDKFKVTPELSKYLSNAMVFENVYAHAPATNKSMVSLLGSVYPWLSYNSITQEHPDVKMPTLSSELKRHGYRTAFFNSGDNSFQQADKFLASRKFDVLRDCKSLNCEQEFHPEYEKWDDLDGMDDECTGNELMEWIKMDSAKPFFGMMWTYQTHYPYYVSGTEKKYNTPDPTFNRYLNAVHHSDEVLGKLLENLKKNGLFESTLVVVVGDHGEAFGRHGQTTHASGIYEENLHIPCIFINPGFKEESNSGIGGMVDVAPTIMDILRLPRSPQWQGESLFAENKNKRVYFFSPWSDYLFGYREGDRKYIFNATKNTTEIYDLKSDPYETKNLSAEFPKEVERCHQCLAGWAQYSNKFMGTLLSFQANISR